MKGVRFFLLGILLLILGTQLPVFLQMTLTPDAVLYDIQTRCLLKGGVLYRDVFEPNLPGVVWVHVMVRSLGGWSPMALRGFDLLVVVGIAVLLSRLVTEPAPDLVHKQTARGIFLCGLLLFYFSTSEWCHCQRDTWMLLPCLTAITVRWHVLKRLSVGQSHQQFLIEPGHALDGMPQAAALEDIVACGLPLNESKTHAGLVEVRSIVLWGLLEGILWALGFWLKPFVAIPALAVLLGSMNHSCTNKGRTSDVRHTSVSRKTGFWFVQTAAVIAGGMITGGIGVAWMKGSGCWPYFMEMLTEWNGDYFQSGRRRWTMERYLLHAERFWPWVLLYWPALVISLRDAWSRLRSVAAANADAPSIAVSLLTSLYLGWIIQAFSLQQLFDYVHVPGVMLAFAVCLQASAGGLMNSRRAGTTTMASEVSWRMLIIPVAIAFAGLCVLSSPVFRWHRQQHWWACVQACQGTPVKPQVQDDLALCPFPRWTELQPLLDRIQQMQIPAGSILAYNGNLIHLYPELRVHPPTRFVYLDALARCFPRHRPEMLAELEHSDVRYVVSNLVEDGWDRDLSGDCELPAPISKNSASMDFPYNQTPICRSGSYVLFEVKRPCGFLTSDCCPLSRHGSSCVRCDAEHDDQGSCEK